MRVIEKPTVGLANEVAADADVRMSPTPPIKRQSAERVGEYRDSRGSAGIGGASLFIQSVDSMFLVRGRRLPG